MHIERTERQASQTLSLSPPVASLLQCCADSAQTILQTLQTLADDDLIGTALTIVTSERLSYLQAPADAFLPFQIEDASSSAFVLYLIRAIAPSLIHSDTWCDNLKCVLDKLIAKGNLAAPLRKRELKQLEQILAPLTPTSTHRPLPSVDLDGVAEQNDEVYALDQVHVGEAFEWDLLGLNDVSLLPTQLSDLADQLDVERIMQSVGCVG